MSYILWLIRIMWNLSKMKMKESHINWTKLKNLLWNMLNVKHVIPWKFISKILHETLRKFTRCRDILDMILFSQRNTYNKIGLGYLSKSMRRNLIIYAMRISLLNVNFFNVIIAINVVMLFYFIYFLLRKIMIVIMYILHLIFIKNVVKAKWEIFLLHLKSNLDPKLFLDPKIIKELKFFASQLIKYKG